MLQLRETTDPTMWVVKDLEDGSMKSFPSYVKALNYCMWSGRKFNEYCKKGIIQ